MVTSLFIDNLPQDFTSIDLREFFGNHSSIVDAYVPPIQRSRVNGRFGFIKVHVREEGERLIQQDDGRIIAHKVIKVNWAKFPRRQGASKGINLSTADDKQRQRGHKIYPVKSNHTYRSSRVIRLETIEENMQWLVRSLVCCTEEPRDVDTIKNWVSEKFTEKIEVRDLGHFKFLLTMESKELKDWLKIEGKESLEECFYSINDWTESEVCQTRRIWVEIVGLPLHFWNESNIRRIATIWGDVVLVDKETSSLDSLASAKVLIDTLSMYQIEEEILIQDENKGFKVFAFEAKTEFTIFHFDSKGKRVPGLNSLENGRDESNQNVDSMMVDVNKPVNIDGVRTGDGEGQTRPDAERFTNSNSKLNSWVHREVDIPRDSNSAEHTPFNVFSGSQGVCETEHAKVNEARDLNREFEFMKEAEGGDECDPSNEAINQASQTRTVTADLSGNNYSVEVSKINQLLKRKTQDNHGEDLDGEETQSQIKDGPVHSNSLSIPPGFEGAAAQTRFNTQKRKLATRKAKSGEGKRVTRSQLKKKNAQIEGFQRRKDSIDTTESMKKTAEEALQVGELLGIKVVSHRENAIKRITETLKASRVQRTRK